MPFKSKKQRSFLYVKKPAVAKKFAAHGGGPTEDMVKRAAKKAAKKGMVHG